MQEQLREQRSITGTEHWTSKEPGVTLFLWNKCVGDPAASNGIVLFVHGSSMASQPTFDLHVPGRPDSSVMDFFAARGYDTWCVDMEGYGRSTKTRNNTASIAQGADDCYAAATQAARQSAAAGLRDFVRRFARRAVCTTSSEDGGAARARRHGVDRGRVADLGRAQQAAA